MTPSRQGWQVARTAAMLRSGRLRSSPSSPLLTQSGHGASGLPQVLGPACSATTVPASIPKVQAKSPARIGVILEKLLAIGRWARRYLLCFSKTLNDFSVGLYRQSSITLLAVSPATARLRTTLSLLAAV